MSLRAIGQGAQDIAIRLRSHETEGVTASDRYHLRNEAAAEIDRLREAVEEARRYVLRMEGSISAPHNSLYKRLNSLIDTEVPNG